MLVLRPGNSRTATSHLASLFSHQVHPSLCAHIVLAFTHLQEITQYWSGCKQAHRLISSFVCSALVPVTTASALKVVDSAIIIWI